MEKPGCGVCSKCGEVIECQECRNVSESTETAGYVDFSGLSREITEVVGRTLYFISKVDEGISIEKIDTENWIGQYGGKTDLPRDRVYFNTFRPTVDKCVAAIMQAVEKYT